MRAAFIPLLLFIQHLLIIIPDYITTHRTKRENRGISMEENKDNFVFIGKKPVMSYVMAVVTQFNKGEAEVIIKARGRSISTAVDVAEISRQRFLKDVEVKGIQTGTEEMEREGGSLRVSSIEITLGKI
jgi:DNA-binding protein